MRDHGSTPYPKEYPPRAPVSSGTAQNERPDPEDDDAHRAPCARTGLPNNEAEAEEGRCLHCGDDLDEASQDDLGHECYPCALERAEARAVAAEAKAAVCGGEWCAKNRAEGRDACGACVFCVEEAKKRSAFLEKFGHAAVEEREAVRDALSARINALEAALEQERAHAKDHISTCSAVITTYAAEARQAREKADTYAARLGEWEPLVRASLAWFDGNGKDTAIDAACRALPPEARPR